MARLGSSVVTGNFGNDLHGFWGCGWLRTAGTPALESEIPSRVRAQTEPGTGAAVLNFGKVLKVCDGAISERASFSLRVGGPVLGAWESGKEIGRRGGWGVSGRIGRNREQRTQTVVRIFGTVFVHYATMAASRFKFQRTNGAEGRAAAAEAGGPGRGDSDSLRGELKDGPVLMGRS